MRTARGRGITALVLLLGGVAALSPAAARADQSAEVVQGKTLRIVSVSDWQEASSMLPGHELRWDVSVSVDDPTVRAMTIDLSATGEASLSLDVDLCTVAWVADDCPDGATLLHRDWEIPRGGGAITLVDVSAADALHLRLGVVLAEGSTGSTTLTVGAHVMGETIEVDSTGALANTGAASSSRVLAVGVALTLTGAFAWGLRWRRSRVSKRSAPT